MRNQAAKRVILPLLGLTLALGTSLVFANNRNKAESVDAIGNYSTNASTYYNGITATSGQALAGQLHDLITSTHQYYTSYADNGANGYQKNTDQYYENSSKVNGYIYEFYSGVKWPNGWYPNAGETNGGYNREHCWCQSNSVNTGGTQMWGESGGGADMHHLRPVETRLNSTRSNNEYGEISNRDSYKVYAKLGTNSTYALGGYNSGGTFEPLDSKKGDVARIILYVYLHYNSYTVTSLFGSGNAKTNGGGSSSYFSTSLLSLTKITNQTTEAKALEMLLQWNTSDPVDAIEQRRNEQVATYQGNRNPFIDNSNYAEMIWGTGSSTPTVNSVSVSPSTLSLDLNGTTTGNLTATVNVSNGAAQTVTWSSSNTNVATVSSSGVVTAVAKGSCTITATSTVNSNKSGSCSVSVANSSGGGGGSSESTTITTSIATYASANSWSNSTKYTSINLDSNATASVGTGSSNTGKYYTSGNEWRFYQSENATIVISVADGYELDSVTFSFNISNGGSLLDSFSNAVTSGSSVSVSGSSATFSVGNSGNASNGQVKFTSISVTYHASSGTAPTLSSISLNTSNVETNFYVNDAFDYSGLIVTAYYSDGTEDIVDATNVSSPDMTTSGNKTITVTYVESGVTKTSTYTITVNSITLSSIEVNDPKTSYYVGEPFVKPTVYANYSNNSAQDVKDSATFNGYNLSVEGEQTVSVSYTYEGVTKTTSYTITVTDSGGVIYDSLRVVSKIDSEYYTSGSIYFSSGGDSSRSAVCSAFTMTQTKISGSTAVSAAYDEIRVYAHHSLMFEPNEGYSISSIVITANSSSYATAVGGTSFTNCTSSVSGSTVTLTPSDGTETIGFTNDAQSRLNYLIVSYSYTPPATLSSISLDTTNVQTTFSVGDTFTYAGLVVTAHYSDNSSSVVTPTSVSTPSTASVGQKTVTVTYTESSGTQTATYTITVSTNPSISWTSPTICEYSGSSLTASNVNGWAVTYNDGAGNTTVLTYDQLTVKLGGTTISIPYIWAADDNGKTLTATYSSLTTTQSHSVEIIQSINNIYAETFTSHTSDLTFTAACGGSGTADDGKTWTVTSDASESNFDSQYGRGIHYGTNNTTTGLVTYISLTSSSFTAGNITKVEINAAAASSATVQVNIGGEAFGGNPKSLDSSAHPTDPYTFTGNVAADDIEVLITKPAAAAKALYCKSIVVTYETASGTAQIANNASHKEAQKQAVLFANAFNATMDDTEYCTTGLDAAWATCSTAYTLFKSGAAALGETEEEWCLNLIKYATRQYSDDSGEACIERMMKTYEVCVQKHGKTAFMSDLVTLGSPQVSPLVVFSNANTSKVAIIVIISLVSVTSIGGYFFLRKRKED